MNSEDAGLLVCLNFNLKEYFCDFHSVVKMSSTCIQLFVLTSLLDSLCIPQ